MSRDRLIAVGGGLLCALLYLSVMSGSTGAIFFTYLSQLPLFLVGLSLGFLPAAIACIVAAGTIAVGANFAAAAGTSSRIAKSIWRRAPRRLAARETCT